jgi:hypothetical protein
MEIALGSMQQHVVRAVVILACALFGSLAPAAGPVSDVVSIQYTLLTSFAGSETATGRISVDVINHADYALSGVTLRLADGERGRLTGPLQEEFDLASGETRRLEGDFVLPVAAFAPGQQLDWLVIYSDVGGFAQQQFVQGKARAIENSSVQALPASIGSAQAQRVN